MVDVAERIETVIACPNLKEARKVANQDITLQNMDEYLKICILKGFENCIYYNCRFKSLSMVLRCWWVLLVKCRLLARVSLGWVFRMSHPFFSKVRMDSEASMGSISKELAI